MLRWGLTRLRPATDSLRPGRPSPPWPQCPLPLRWGGGPCLCRRAGLIRKGHGGQEALLLARGWGLSRSLDGVARVGRCQRGRPGRGGRRCSVEGAALPSSIAPGLARSHARGQPAGSHLEALFTPPPSFPGRKSPEGPSRGAPRPVRTASGWGSPSGVWGAGSVEDGAGQSLRGMRAGVQTEPLIIVSSRLSTSSAAPVPNLRSSVATAHKIMVSTHARCHCGLCPGWAGLSAVRGGGGPGSWRRSP